MYRLRSVNCAKLIVWKTTPRFPGPKGGFDRVSQTPMFSLLVLCNFRSDTQSSTLRPNRTRDEAIHSLIEVGRVAVCVSDPHLLGHGGQCSRVRIERFDLGNGSLANDGPWDTERVQSIGC